MKQYDANFIFVHTGRDEAWAKTIERMQGEIARIGGKVLGTEDRGKKTFARPQQKKESGTYLTIRFELEPAKVNELRARYALIEGIFRIFLCRRSGKKFFRKGVCRGQQSALNRSRTPYSEGSRFTAGRQICGRDRRSGQCAPLVRQYFLYPGQIGLSL